MKNVRVGIIGHAQNKFTAKTEEIAKTKIREILQEHLKKHNEVVVVSGHSPLGGVDIWAEEIAKEMGLMTDIKAPIQRGWMGKYGYKARNIDIAKCSDVIHIILVKEYSAEYRGLKFNKCYHCAKHHFRSDHVKSGACWTGHYAVVLGKEVIWHVII